MMPMNQPRRHSLSSGDESFYPYPARADGLPRRGSRRRACPPRSKSTSNVVDAFSPPLETTDNDLRNIVLEQADIGTLRELADFLRTTGPPPERPATYDECLRLPGSGVSKRWSLQSLRRNKRMRLQRQSFRTYLPENAIPGTTASGHRYIAIPTPAPENSNNSGPWFRSQYPVFLPQPRSAPPSRCSRVSPDRHSSKTTPVSDSEKGTTPAEIERSRCLSSRTVDKELLRRDPVPEGARSRALSNRVSTDRLLRAMLNPADEGFEYNLEASLKQLGSQTAPAIEEAQLGTLGKSSERLVDILVHNTLAVPKESVPPESPGFPNMLATMSFPSPPRSSRPSSPSSVALSVADSQVSLGSRPVVTPRTSSRRARVSTSISAASLDEVIMKKRPSSRHVKSHRSTQPWTEANSGTAAIEARSASRSPKAPIQRSNPLEHSVCGGVAHGTAGLTDSAGYVKAGVLLCGDGKESHRESLTSQLTVTTNYSKNSTLTYSSSLSSAVSGMSARRRATITPSQPHFDARQHPEEMRPAASEGCAHDEDVVFKTDANCEDLSSTETDNSNSERDYDEDTRPKWQLSTPKADTESNPQPRSILERRLARKAKVREYKMRDLDASRVDVVDSPILGYFAPSLPGGSSSVVEGPLAPSNGVQRRSMLSMTTTSSEAIKETMSTNAQTLAPLHYRDAQKEELDRINPGAEVPRPPNAQFTISAIIATDIEPVNATSRWHTSGITMSPIMVVADVESRPGSHSLLFSTLTPPDSGSPRTMTRLKPLKIGTHTRQKSHTVTISRNPATGAIERSASGPIDFKLKRRSLMTVPTPPLSPEAAQLPNKRLSLPPVRLTLPITHRDRTSSPPSQEWQSSYAEEAAPEGRPRSTASLKERVMREKLQKEKEITDIVARTVGLPQKQSVSESEWDPLPPDQHSTDSLEERLTRLERTNKTWLCAMKPLLETMARTLDDMRAEDRCRSLRMSDFVIDMEAEARRVTHSGNGEKGTVPMILKGPGDVVSANSTTRNARKTPLSPILQGFSDSPGSDKEGAPMTFEKGGEDGSRKDEASSTTV